jgi:hypothetical protein
MRMKFPEPDIEEFKKVLKRKEKGKRIHIAELHIDKEILIYLWENFLGKNGLNPLIMKHKKKH